MFGKKKVLLEPSKNGAIKISVTWDFEAPADIAVSFCTPEGDNVLVEALRTPERYVWKLELKKR